MDDQIDNRITLKKKLKATYDEVKKLGGFVSLKSGEWLLPLIHRSFTSYYKNANADYFRQKYPSASDEYIIEKLISIAAKNSALLGVITGAAVSIDEISAIVATLPALGLNIPAQLAVAGTALGAEAIFLVRIQLQLIANIAKILDVPLNPEDPEDVLVVLAFALGGAGAEAVGKFGARTAGHLVERGVRKHISGATLQALKKFGAMIGVKILQGSIIKYTVPLISSAIGGGWNFFTTRKVGTIATKHFLGVLNESAKN